MKKKEISILKTFFVLSAKPCARDKEKIMLPATLRFALFHKMPFVTFPAVEFPPEIDQILRSNYSEPSWNDIRGALAVPPRTTFLRVNTLRCTRSEAKQKLQTYINQVQLGKLQESDCDC